MAQDLNPSRRTAVALVHYRLDAVTVTANGWTVGCPAHRESTHSMSLRCEELARFSAAVSRLGGEA